ncbi:MAG: LLM class flavin-dependent oxidoreductase [Ilumatobacteraceae bacterium]
MSATHPGLRIGAVPASGFNTAAPDERARSMRALADAGLDGVLQADHVSFLDGSGTGAIVMAGLSGAHPTLGLHIGVYLLPLRHPVTVARSLVTLDQLAPGRVVFGVGIGGEDRHEVEVCGVDPRTRGRRCGASLSRSLRAARWRHGHPRRRVLRRPRVPHPPHPDGADPGAGRRAFRRSDPPCRPLRRRLARGVVFAPPVRAGRGDVRRRPLPPAADG